MTECSVCGWRPIARGNRCDSCRAFYRRHGRDRTPNEILRNYEQTKDRELVINPEIRGHIPRAKDPARAS
jgi:hypothetical protein